MLDNQKPSKNIYLKGPYHEKEELGNVRKGTLKRKDEKKEEKQEFLYGKQNTGKQNERKEETIIGSKRNKTEGGKLTMGEETNIIKEENQ